MDSIGSISLTVSGAPRLTEKNIEGVGFPAAAIILDENDCGTVRAGFMEEMLGASAINATETEVRGDGGHGAVAVETAPRRAFALACMDLRGLAVDFHFGNAIDDKFQRAFAAAAATVYVCRSNLRGKTGGEGDEEEAEDFHARWIGLRERVLPWFCCLSPCLSWRKTLISENCEWRFGLTLTAKP